MNFTQRWILIATLAALSVSKASFAIDVDFTGQLDIIEIDSGQSVFSGATVGSPVFGFVDDVLVEGNITVGSTFIEFNCCDAAGGLSMTNNLIIDEDSAEFLNQLSGTQDYNPGDSVDLVDLEGDTQTANSSRIEIGLSFILPSNTFNDGQPYTLDTSDVQFSFAFILEDAMDKDIYLAYSAVEIAIVDSDGDGVSDSSDNCTLVLNADQRDSNNDGIGNRCDADIDNNCVVNFLDFSPFPLAFGATKGDANFNADLDVNSDGIIAFLDIGIYPAQFGGPPGPSSSPCVPQ